MSVNTWLWYWVSGEWCWPWWAKEHETRGKGHIHSALSPVTTTKLSEGTPPTNKSTCHLFAPYDMQVISLQLPYKGLWAYAFQLLTCYRDSLSRLPIWTLWRVTTSSRGSLLNRNCLSELAASCPPLSLWRDEEQDKSLTDDDFPQEVIVVMLGFPTAPVLLQLWHDMVSRPHCLVPVLQSCLFRSLTTRTASLRVRRHLHTPCNFDLQEAKQIGTSVLPSPVFLLWHILGPSENGEGKISLLQSHVGKWKDFTEKGISLKMVGVYPGTLRCSENRRGHTEAYAGNSACSSLPSLSQDSWTPQPSSVSIQPTGNLYPTLIHFMGMLLTTLASSSPQAGPSFPAPFSTLKQHQLWALGSPAVLRFSDKRCFQSFIGEGEKVCTNTLGALGLTGVGELV